MISPKRIIGVRRGVCLLPALALLGGCNAVLLSPAGDLAVRQRDIIIVSTCLMLLIIVPVIFLTLLFAWRYRESNREAVYTPEWDHSTLLELLIWAAPLLIIIALGALTWVDTHKLDPYRPLSQIDARRPLPPDVRPLTVEVVALDWKWLFFYPEQGIATVNELAAPVDRPIRFKITASTVMNSFFVPAIAGQVYAMPGMETRLHAVINRAGEYDGFSANYSGAGFSDMRFKFHGMSAENFDTWVRQVKADGKTLTRAEYARLAQPSEREPVRHYADTAAGLYDAILNRCVAPGQTCIKDMMPMRGGHQAASPQWLADALCTADNVGAQLSALKTASGEGLPQ
ncbi:ubiquinol oxidase subunit II [Pandoraea terrae]|nr:ubiquinol oxidase subunit II [Pandoraea terrae]